MTTETNADVEDTDLFVNFASSLKDQLDAIRLEVTGKPGDLLLSLSKRIGTFTPALEALCAKFTEKALVDNDFRAADDLSEMIINALKNDRVEMLPALMDAYKKAVPHNWLWPTGPNAPRIQVKDVDSKPMPFFYLAKSREATDILLDDTAKDVVNYQQALSDGILQKLAEDNIKALEPLVAAYKKAVPEKWSWPLGSSIDDKGTAFLTLAKSMKAVEIFIEPDGSPASAYHQALSNAIFHFIEKESSTTLGFILHAYQKVRPDNWQEPVEGTAKGTFLLHAAWKHRVNATKLLLDEGADPNKICGNFYSPLFAALQGFAPYKSLTDEKEVRQIAHLLIDKNADPAVTGTIDRKTYSCLKLIKYTRDKDLLKKADSMASASHPTETSWYWGMRRPNPTAEQ